MKKIGVYLDLGPEAGGQYQYDLLLLEALNRLGKEEYKVVAVYFCDVWKEILEKYNFEKIYLQDTLDGLREKIMALEIDLWINTSNLGRFNLVDIIPEMPFISVIHDMNIFFDKNVYEGAHNRYDEKMCHRKNVCFHAEGILVDSLLGRNQVVKVFGEICKEKIYVVPFAAPTYLLLDEGDDFERMKKVLPPKYIFYPATLAKHKNHINLLKAVNILKRKNIHIKIVFCGNIRSSYEEISDYIDHTELNDNVYILGYVSNDEIRYIYKHARAMIFPTLVGPTSIPPLEAMQLECPVAVSRIGAMDEQVGKNGMLFDPYNVEEMASCIERLWNDDDLCKRLIENGKIQREYYSLNRFCENIKNCIDECIKNINEKQYYLKILKEKIKDYEVVCYGAGNIGFWFANYFKSQGIKVAAFVDKYSEKKEFQGISVYHPYNLNCDKDKTIIVLTLREENYCNVKSEMMSLGYKNFYEIQQDKELKEIFGVLNCYPW